MQMDPRCCRWGWGLITPTASTQLYPFLLLLLHLLSYRSPKVIESAKLLLD